MRFLLGNARLVLEPAQAIGKGWLLVENGLIKQIGSPCDKPPSGVPVVDCGEDFVAPGLVDIHCHGAVGHDAMEASPEAFREILGYHALCGTTTVMLTTVAAAPEKMLAVLRAAREYNDEPGCAHLAGIHLEGPWFSPRRRGAHQEECLRLPDDAEIEALLEYRDVLRRVTLAPELPGAEEAIRKFREAGIAVSAGHSDATRQEAAAGFREGITQVTHLYNAMSSFRKGKEGLAEEALATPGILCEVIADGVHLSPELLHKAWDAKGWEHLALVSDATAGCGLPEGSRFQLGELACEVRGGAAWTGEGTSRCLAGSTAALFDGIRIMSESAGVPLEQAVAMASLVPARSLGLDHRIGSLGRAREPI